MSSVGVGALLDLLRSRGTTPAREVMAALRVSQPTLSRLARTAGPSVVRIGSARRSRYALRREVSTLGHAWPVYSVDRAGIIQPAATLHAIHPRQWWYAAARLPEWLRGDFADGVFPDLPWFLDDLRPQGFLGRAFARRHAERLGLGADPRLWSADAVVAALLQCGDDLPGNLLLGDAAAERLQGAMRTPPVAIAEVDRAQRYEELATAAMAGDLAGSSAGGEQPKFTTCSSVPGGSYRQVIVKFSPPQRTAVGRRWADLLRCEHLAAGVVEGAGLPASRSAWVEGELRVFLEVERFDRVGAWGRCGVVSLLAFDAAYYGLLDSWTAAADRMQRDGWLDGASADALRVLWWFGRLIGNSDMHFGNVGLLLGDERVFSLAPTYDMLPMQYRPTSTGEIVDSPFTVAMPPPPQRQAWQIAAEMACVYWQRIAEDGVVSAGFRKLARANGSEVQRVVGRNSGSS